MAKKIANNRKVKIVDILLLMIAVYVAYKLIVYFVQVFEGGLRVEE